MTLRSRQARATKPHRIGLIVNPIAGLGGAVGLKGTDGRAVSVAQRLGAKPAAEERATRAVSRLRALVQDVVIVLARGPAGTAAVCQSAGTVEFLPMTAPARTSAWHTRRAARLMAEAKVDLLLFAGGDGTARDVMAAIGHACPVLGVPAGVKMQSGVFAITPEAAAHAVADWLSHRRLQDGEVMDIDEEELRQGRVTARLFGTVRIPAVPAAVQSSKAGARLAPETALQTACWEAARAMRPGRLYLFGPGTTAQRVLAAMGLQGTLLGVDAVLDGRIAGADLGEAAILQLMEGRQSGVIAGVPGGQGCLFGRGNQQIGGPVLSRIARGDIWVLASLDKLLALSPRRLFVDTGLPELDRRLSGYLPVRTAAGQAHMLRVDC